MRELVIAKIIDQERPGVPWADLSLEQAMKRTQELEDQLRIKLDKLSDEELVNRLVDYSNAE